MSVDGTPSPHARRGGVAECLVVVAGATALMAALTYPFVGQMAHVGRLDTGDGAFSIWNVAWVARALVRDPLHVFNANIFYPHRGTLAYSESNLGAGALAVPVYWATRNPYLAHNAVVVCAFVMSAVGMYYLVRYLTGDRRAAAVSGICFGFCPYAFARTPEIQLMMTAGLPFCMLALHRLVDRPQPGRAVTLGAVMAGQAVCCGYYGVFAALMVGLGVLLVAATRRSWMDPRYWIVVSIAALSAVALIAPVFAPYLLLQRATAFARPLQEAARYSANGAAYLASPTFGSSWMIPFIGPFSEVLFPGFVSTMFGLAGLAIGLRGGARSREVAVVYGTVGGLAFWASFGPAAGLYRALYAVVPLFTWLRAPARFGILVALATSVLAGLAVHALLSRVRRGTVLGAGLAVCAAIELAVPLRFSEVPPVSPAYLVLGRQVPAPVIELPFWWRGSELHGHTSYMLSSTTHWMPLVNGYSDYIPADFREAAETLASFPSAESFTLLESRRPKYAVFHMSLYGEQDRAAVAGRIAAFSDYLYPLYVDNDTRLYRIVGFPAAR